MKRKILVGVLVILTALLSFGIYVKATQPKIVYTPNPNLKAPIEIPAKSVSKIQDLKDTDKPVLALFYVDWCSFCRRFMPVFGELALKYNKYDFAVVNCDYPENRALVEKIGIISYPSVLVLDPKNDFSFSLSPASIQYEDYFKSELQNYLKLRERLDNKKVDKDFLSNIIVHK